MRRPTITPTGVARTFDTEALLVTKTDPKGIITYANETFIEVSGYARSELIGAPHSLIRHPDMPRGIFRLLWQRIQAGREIFAYVKNMASNGDHYWVLAHVTPTFGLGGQIVGYHSNRRFPEAAAVVKAEALFAEMRREEARHQAAAEAARQSLAVLDRKLADMKTTYDEMLFAA